MNEKLTARYIKVNNKINPIRIGSYTFGYLLQFDDDSKHCLIWVLTVLVI